MIENYITLLLFIGALCALFLLAALPFELVKWVRHRRLRRYYQLNAPSMRDHGLNRLADDLRKMK